MDGCAPTIPKHVPQRNLSLCGKNTPMSLMRLVVCFDGQILHTVTVSPPSSSNAHPVPHASFSTFYSFHNLLLYSSGYLVILILFLSFSPAFCRPVAFARLPVSPLPLPPLPAFPSFLPITGTALVYKFPFQKSASRFLRALKICISHFLFIT